MPTCCALFVLLVALTLADSGLGLRGNRRVESFNAARGDRVPCVESSAAIGQTVVAAYWPAKHIESRSVVEPLNRPGYLHQGDPVDALPAAARLERGGIQG